MTIAGTTQPAHHDAHSRPSLATVLRAGGIAAVLAAVLNLIVYFFARELLDVSFAVPLGGAESELEPIPPALVAALTVAGAAGATILLAVLARVVSRPVRTFVIVAIVFLLLSLVGPLTLGGGTSTATKIWLEVLHLVAGTVIIATFARLVPEGGRVPS